MKITGQLTDSAILEEIGSRLARHRIDSGLTQAALAAKAGVAKRTLERLESGHGTELVTLVRLLRALEQADGLEAAILDLPPSPIAMLKRRGKLRQRAPRRPPKAGSKPWTWGS